MARSYRHVLVVADMEGATGCWSRPAAALGTDAWAAAGKALSLDVQAACRALLAAGVGRVTVQDFHRTGYNILGEYLPAGVRLQSGFRPGPVPGIGTVDRFDAAVLLGMHAASGTDGFLAHTLTSRLARVQVAGRPVAEVDLLAAALQRFCVPVVFFTGCPVACAQARRTLPGLTTFALDKAAGPGRFCAASWRRKMASSLNKALQRPAPQPVLPKGPLVAKVTMRDGPAAAARLAARWKLPARGDTLELAVDDMAQLFARLAAVCYLVPWQLPLLAALMPLANLKGRLALSWVRWKLRAGRLSVTVEWQP